GVPGRQLDEPAADVDAHDLDPPLGQGPGVAARPAADVEHPHPRLEAQLVDEERHLVGRPLRERVAQVGVAEVVGERLEPVAGGVGHRAPIVPRAPAAAAVWAPWTSPSPAATARSPAASSACWRATAPAPGPSSATPTTPPTAGRPGHSAAAPT